MVVALAAGASPSHRGFHPEGFSGLLKLGENSVLIVIYFRDESFFVTQSVYKRTNTDKALKEIGGTYPVVTDSLFFHWLRLMAERNTIIRPPSTVVGWSPASCFFSWISPYSCHYYVPSVCWRHRRQHFLLRGGQRTMTSSGWSSHLTNASKDSSSLLR